jgi:hypothetical protein
MSSLPAPTIDEIARDARWLVQALDPASETVRLVAMDEEAYRAASFLDDRMLHDGGDQRLVSWSTVADAAARVQKADARWIFHIGHVGSTLMARLLGEVAGVLSVREPRFLRDIATLPADRRREFTRLAPAIFARTFSADQAALVKATSFVSEIAPELVTDAGRALFMYASAPSYIASILAGPASRQELAAYAQSRSQRLKDRIARLADPARSEAYAAAAAWACEMTSLEAASDKIGDEQLLWMDFDRALEGLPDAIARSSLLFGFDASANDVDRIATGPLSRRYSKATEYEYSPGLRREVIAEAARDNARDIRDALAMLEDAAQESPLLARALQRSTSEA